MPDRQRMAEGYFRQGYNCAQAVALAFEDLLTLDKEQLLRLASPFGGGMGRMREVCGAFSGALLVLGTLAGYERPDDQESKAALYARVQALGAAFRQEHGTLICRELLKDTPVSKGSVPEIRDEAFYASRPCLHCIGDMARLLERELAGGSATGTPA